MQHSFFKHSEIVLSTFFVSTEFLLFQRYSLAPAACNSAGCIGAKVGAKVITEL